MGPDGHTASLIPGDPALDVNDRDIALTGVYQGRRRMTMYPLLNRGMGQSPPVGFAATRCYGSLTERPQDKPATN